ncbi:RNA polymerase sigma factor [Sphingobacterium hotanense]|uniref:RNA polymerase sigma-70 factor n=1 Tax=Sphingobacterium hotanense TaxID=649196 RepID=A0ABT7NKC6_9SPHI|nr:RNA polymerase sigma-70 factor [Sphingobacterium hotanense]MDM1047679.1 RNA polymerase sigma-70 factor [Sphingobacterium hotanense]
MLNKDAEADIVLWKGIVESDQQSFAALYKKYSSILFSSAYRILKDKEICEDIIQEVFVRIWLKRFEIQIKNVRSYLYQSVKNKVIDLIRNKKNNIQLSEIEDIIATEQTDSHVLKKEVETAIDQSIQQLPERCAEIFYLKKEQHLSNKEIAQKLNISTKTVENQITVAIKKLKIALSGRMDFFIPIFLYLFFQSL